MPGTAQQSAQLTGVSDPKNHAVAQFCSAALAAQSVAAGTWKLGFALQSAQALAYTAQVYVALVNGSTGAVRTRIIASDSGTVVAVGATRSGSGELTNYSASLSGSAFTASAGDYLLVEVGFAYSTTPSSATQTLYADWTTAITADDVATTSAQSFLTAPAALQFQAPPPTATSTSTATFTPTSTATSTATATSTPTNTPLPTVTRTVQYS